MCEGFLAYANVETRGSELAVAQDVQVQAGCCTVGRKPGIASGSVGRTPLPPGQP